MLSPSRKTAGEENQSPAWFVERIQNSTGSIGAKLNSRALSLPILKEKAIQKILRNSSSSSSTLSKPTGITNHSKSKFQINKAILNFQKPYKIILQKATDLDAKIELRSMDLYYGI